MAGFNKLGRIIAGMESQAQAALDYTVADWEAKAWVLAPVDDGDLQNSLTHRKTAKYRRQIDVPVAHAAPQEFGSVAHVIPGGWGRVGGVNHPGNAPQPYLRPSRDQVEPMFRTMMRQILEP